MLCQQKIVVKRGPKPMVMFRSNPNHNPKSRSVEMPHQPHHPPWPHLALGLGLELGLKVRVREALVILDEVSAGVDGEESAAGVVYLQTPINPNPNSNP